jgi:hypothetical protein
MPNLVGKRFAGEVDDQTVGEGIAGIPFIEFEQLMAGMM